MHCQYDSPTDPEFSVWGGASAKDISLTAGIGFVVDPDEYTLSVWFKVFVLYVGVRLSKNREQRCDVCGEYQEDHLHTNWRACGHFTRK